MWRKAIDKGRKTDHHGSCVIICAVNPGGSHRALAPEFVTGDWRAMNEEEGPCCRIESMGRFWF